TTRRVVARQGARAIFNLAASFQIEEVGSSHQAPAPTVSGPEGLPSERELALRFAELIPKKLRERAIGERPIEIRPVRPVNPMHPDVREPIKHVWLKAVDPLGDDMALHRYLLAYASDFHFLTTALHPHGISWMTRGLQLASLDHAMYFHRPFRFDEWLLYAIDSPSSSGARGLVRGQLFNREGVLVASCVQEGLMRQHEMSKDATDAQ
ncbi:MAG: acyl-CoA thioesterase II, partial [Nannocystaceae bacterium]